MRPGIVTIKGIGHFPTLHVMPPPKANPSAETYNDRIVFVVDPDHWIGGHNDTERPPPYKKVGVIRFIGPDLATGRAGGWTCGDRDAKGHYPHPIATMAEAAEWCWDDRGDQG